MEDSRQPPFEWVRAWEGLSLPVQATQPALLGGAGNQKAGEWWSWGTCGTLHNDDGILRTGRGVLTAVLQGEGPWGFRGPLLLSCHTPLAMSLISPGGEPWPVFGAERPRTSGQR